MVYCVVNFNKLKGFCVYEFIGVNLISLRRKFIKIYGLLIVIHQI
jgi:hypothetical protein